MVNKIVTCIMGQNCSKFIKMCYESVKDSDIIIFCDGGSNDGTIEYLKSQGFKYDTSGKKRIIFNKFDKYDKKMNGRQRNFYLKYLKEHFSDYWALCIDADEVVEDLSKIKKEINNLPPALYSVKMRHFIGDLGHEDTTQKEHFVPNRLFKIEAANKYPEIEHPVLTPNTQYGYMLYNGTTIWHLAYIPNLWSIKERYEQHKLKSEMHSPQFLDWWYRAHLFGTYPKAEINTFEIPNIILKEFGIDKEELYFKNRGIEVKHFIDAKNWKDFFKCKTAAEWGCGLGPRVYAMNTIGIKAYGWEVSNYAVKNKMHENISQADITKHNQVNKTDLVIAYDLLEHIPYNKLDEAIKNLIKSTKKHILISVPVIGDPNLEADPTHIIKETKDWWRTKFLSFGLEEIQVPEYFLFKEQLMIFKK